MMYLAVHGDTIVDLTAFPVKVSGPLQFPAPVSRHAAAAIAGVRVPLEDEYAVRVIPVEIKADTTAEAEDAFTALKRACETYRARLVWRSDTGPQIWTTIRSAHVSEPQMDWLERNHGVISAVLTFTTDSEWTGAPEALDASGNVEVTKGDRPARMRLKVTSASANPCIGIGVKHAPGEDYEPVDTYASPSAVTLTGTYAALGTAPDIDTNDNRGAHVVIPKVATTDVTSRFRAVSKVTGSGMADSTSATYQSTAALATGARYTPLPELVKIPAGGVPGIETGSGYRAESDIITQDTQTESVAVPAVGCIGQTFTLDSVLADIGLTLYLTNTAGYALFDLEVWSVVGGKLGTEYAVVTVDDEGGFSGTMRVDFSSLNLPPGDYIWLASTESAVTGFSIHRAADDYAGGSWATAGFPGSGVTVILDEDYDAYFVLHGRLPLGFDTTTTIQGKCDESSKTATLSETVRLPADDWCAVYEHAFGADEGVLVEATDPLTAPLAYLTTDADGTAGPATAPVISHGLPRLRPGTNQIVVAAEGTVTRSGVYYPCYSNAAAGEL